jgi:phosphoribosylformylglycinamidine synthase
MSTVPDSPFSPEEIASEGIKPDEYNEIVDRLGRHPNKAELGMFGVMWSEHCCYKNSRPLLSQFPTTGDRVLVGPGENAGVVDFGDGIRLAFKIESHNHPSAIEPFQGAATGVGGILRDIFTMGARPIAALNSLRFGHLEDARNRRIFKGVVDGISHYGNCLTADERIVWRDAQGAVQFEAIGDFVDRWLPQGVDTLTLDDTSGIETYSLDPETHRPCWQPIRRLFKRVTQNLLQFKTALGRTVTVTPDHPFVVLENGTWQERAAKTFNVGDRLPLVFGLPLEPSTAPTAIDLLDLVATTPQLQPGTFIRLPQGWTPSDELRQHFSSLEPSPQTRHRYLRGGYFPLATFLKLESLIGVSRRDLSLYRRSGKANYMHAVVDVDEQLARFLGYYLAEGCVSRNGNTDKIVLTFALHEREYIYEVMAAFKALGLNPCLEERSSTYAVYVTSWLFGYLLRDVWQCGHGATTKAMPAQVFQWPRSLQWEVIKGLLRGDGGLTTRCKGSHAKMGFATVSRTLFEQTLTLLQHNGIIASVYTKPARTVSIRGRDCNCAPVWGIEVSNYEGLTKLVDVFGRERDAQLQTALDQYEGDRHSFPRAEIIGDLAFVKIREIEPLSVAPTPVYDIEVDQTHLFVTSTGLLTHNCFGVPTVGGEVYFDPAYSGNPLVNAMAIGLMETDEIVKSGASGVGNPVIYVGSTTGRDGMGGASFASAELTDDSMDDRPAVQVGDPFLEKCLVEACLEAFKTGAVVAAQDMGAAGLTCSTSEMAANGGVGIELDLDKIPSRETGMVPYEYLLSESQERMLFVGAKGREQELIDIFENWGLQAVVAGRVVEEPVVRILWHGEVAADIPASALTSNTPLYKREVMAEPPEYAQTAWAWSVDSLPDASATDITIADQTHTWNDILLTLLDTPSLASKRWVYRQYDHQVQNNTVLVPGGGDAAVIRLRSVLGGADAATQRGCAATVDCNSRYVYLDPHEGAKYVVAEAARNLSCVGAEPVAVTDNLNFGSPEKPIGYWQLASACAGLSDACAAFNTPVTGGNVSLYNETLDSTGKPTPIYPTPVVGMVGLVDDVSKIVGQAFQSEGDVIYLLGANQVPTLGASEYLATIHGTIVGKPPRVDYDAELAVQAACRTGIRSGWIRSAHDCAEGGLAVALAESCIAGGIGASVDVANVAGGDRVDALLFGETGARIVVSVARSNVATWEAFLTENLGENWCELGTVHASRLIIENHDTVTIDADLATIADRFNTAIERRL